MEIALQMGCQGLAYMHSDLGVFAGANLDDELYARWLQYGVFQPVFRPHAQEECLLGLSSVLPRRKSWRGRRLSCAIACCLITRFGLLKIIRLATPLMRPLMFADPSNREFAKHANNYLWGEDFLVQPVTIIGRQTAEVRFPGNKECLV